MDENKSYYEFMNEITADELYEGLLAHGMFAEKLPPILTSEPFFQYCGTLSKPFNGSAHRYIYYENMRNINIPRPLAIPNPFAYQLQCEILRDNWENIKAHFSTKTSTRPYKASRIHIRKMHDVPALFQMNYENWRTDGDPIIDISLGKRYVVKADIAKCFPSIYTHALSWALVGKDVAKRTRKNKKEWYNKIDEKTRKTTSNETHGLLIGPHSSNILSEIILTSVDHELETWSYIRAIDDYTCFVDTYEKGQQFLTCLNAALREYDMSLNHKKTAILELPLAATKLWKRRLNSTQLTTSYGKTDYLLTRAYLDFAIELMHENGENAAILNYAIKTLLGETRKDPSKILTKNAREYAAKTIMSLAELYPYLITLLDKYVFKTCCDKCISNHKCIEDYSNRVYHNSFETRNFEQASYALYFAVKYSFELAEYDVSRIIDSKDCILLLMAFLYSKEKKNNDAVKKLKQYAKCLKDDLETFDQYWLFLYEILPKSDLKADWFPMKKAGVSFVRDISTW